MQFNAAGQVELKLKTPLRDGTTHLVMSPLEFMQRVYPSQNDVATNAIGIGRRHPALVDCASLGEARVTFGMATDSSTATVGFEQLPAFVAGALVHVGLPAADAARVASLMAQADLQGSDGHGVIGRHQAVKKNLEQRP